MILTIGHSTRTLDELIALLHAHGVTQVGDVRTVPKSRRHPQFAREALEQSLPAAAISYRHFPGLGGLRKPRRESINTAWRNDSFRGYADYMQTAAFERALDELIAWAGEPLPEEIAVTDSTGQAEGQTRSGGRRGKTAIMCAEAVWWRCHRQLIADALLGRGISVRHITAMSAASLHTLTDFARIDPAGRVTYPGLL